MPLPKLPPDCADVRTSLLTCLLLCLTMAPVCASAQALVSIAPSRDATLFADAVDNASGRGDLFAGLNGRGDERRLLIAFDDLDRLPADIALLDVSLRLQVLRTSATEPVRMTLHRVTRTWVEGPTSSPGGGGVPAQNGDVTWRHGLFPLLLWQQPGGDFDPEPLSEAQVGSGSVVFPGTAELLALVDSWRSGATENHGLLIRVDESAGRQSSRRFGSRESVNAAPSLEVTLDAQPAIVSGLWSDPELDGEGFNLVQDEAGLIVFFFGYDSLGQRLWLASETFPGPLLLERDAQLQMFVGAGGNFQTPAPASELAVWGTLDLRFSSCDEGRFELSGSDGNKLSQAVRLATVAGADCDRDAPSPR